MFEKVARFVTKRYKLIVIAWIAALLFAVPFAPQLFDVLQYEETRMAPTNIESEVAQRYINDHFGNVSSQGSTIIVLTDSNMLGNDTKNAVYQIDDGIFDAVRQDANSIVVKVDSLYSAGEHYLTSFLMGMSSSYATVAEQTNLTAFAIFGLPTQFQSLYNNTNQTAFMIYGIPDIYNQTWTTLYHGSLNVDIADNQTYASVGAMLQSLESSMDPSMQQMVGAWYQVFTEAWNKTSNIPGVQINPVLRAQLAQSNAFEPFLSGIEAFVPANQTDFLSLVNSSFSFTTYNNFHALSAFSYSLLVQNIDSNLGNATQDEKDVVSTYFDAFYSSWNASASAPSETAFRGMVANAVGTVAASLPTEEGQFLQAVYAGLGLSAWNNSSAINAFAANVITAAPNVEPWVMDQLLSLGPNPSLTQISNMAGEIVQNSSVTEFPVPFPQELIDSFVSPDNTTMIISLTYTNETGGAADGQAFVGPVREVVRNVVQGTNMTAYVTGSDPIGSDMQGSLAHDLELIEPVTIILVLVLIGLYFRSFIASAIPPLFIGLALGIAFGLVYFIGAYVLSIHYSVVTLMLTSMMGAGCDYCIFILSRYREERRNGQDKTKAVNTALTWAGESIATSGATVIIGFGVLSLGRYDMLKSMGVSLALGVTIALLAALTLLPAALMIAGDKMFWPAKFRIWSKMKARSVGYFTRSAKFAIKNAKIILIAALVISIPTTYLVYTLDTSYDFIGAMPDTESKAGLDVMTSDFGGGKMLPTFVALNMMSPVNLGNGSFNITELNAIEDLSQRISNLSNVKQVVSPTRPLEETVSYANFSAYTAEETAQIKASMQRMIGNDQKSVLINVIMISEPFAKESIDTISTLRQIAYETPQSDPSILAMYVGGSTASMKDISDMVGSDFSTIEIVVVIGIYIVLLVVLGSVINPLRSILTILLSISWTLAVTMVIFQFYLSQPILWMLPMILLVVCLGLGMDYDILLTTRIREEASKGRGDKEAIVHAVERTGGIITACGIIMAAAFGSMMLSQGALLQEFGFALMFAILLDATVVRIYLVPAIMSLLGKWNWWAPGPLQRVNRSRQKCKLDEMKQVQGEVDFKTAVRK